MVGHEDYDTTGGVYLLQTIISKQHDVVYGNLIKFISSSHKKLQSIYYSAKKSKNQPLMLGIPTAVLLAGVNMPDHDVLFERLKKTIHKSPTPYVVQLNASDCSSGTTGPVTGICLSPLLIQE